MADQTLILRINPHTSVYFDIHNLKKTERKYHHIYIESINSKAKRFRIACMYLNLLHKSQLYINKLKTRVLAALRYTAFKYTEQV